LEANVYEHVFCGTVDVKFIIKSVIVLCQEKKCSKKAKETPKDDLINARNAFLIKEE